MSFHSTVDSSRHFPKILVLSDEPEEQSSAVEHAVKRREERLS